MDKEEGGSYMEKESNTEGWVNIREIGIVLNVHAFVIYSFLLQNGIKYAKDRYGNGYVNGADITKHFEELKTFVKSLRNGRKTQLPLKELAFIDPVIGIHNDWESKADGLDKVKKVFHASLNGKIYRINHYQNFKKALFRWDRITRAWRYVEEEKAAHSPDEWLKKVTIKYQLCNTIYDEEQQDSCKLP